ATATSAPASILTEVSGNNQIGASNQPLANPFEVMVQDDFGNPKPNHPVIFTVIAGGGTLDGGSSTATINTDQSGIARATLTLGPSDGIDNVVEASSTEGGTPLINSPITFQAASAVPAKLVRLTGDGQSGTATQPLDAPFKVLVLDNLDRPISGYPVQFDVTQGNGTINGQSSTVISTASNGEASATLVMGPTPGAQNAVEISALSQGAHLTGSPVTFRATAAQLSAIQLVDGNNQTGSVGAELAGALKVKVVDTRGKGIKGWPVTFTVKDGGGKLTGDVAVATINTDSLGLASVGLTLGSTPGTNNNVVEATTSYNNKPLSGSPIVFQASAKVGTPVALTIAAGDKQRGVVGLPLPQPLQAKVVDVLGNGIPNYEVTFEVKAGGGNLGGVTTKKVVTNQSGIAQVTLTVGGVAGEENNVVEVRAFSGQTPLGNSPLLFTASATSSSARFMEYVSGSNQQGTAGFQLPQSLTLKVTDGTQNRNPVPNHPVIFTVKAGGGTLNGGTESEVVVSTNAQGEAQVTWVLGGLVAPDSQFVEAASTDGQQPLTGSGVRFAARAAAGPTSPTISYVEATGPVPADGSSKSNVTVHLKDKFGNPITGHAISVRVSGDGNSVNQPLSLTNTEGIVEASFSSIRSGEKVVTAFDINGQIEVTNSDTVTFVPLAAQRLVLESGNGQTRNVGTTLANPLVAKVTDVNGNPVSGWPVDFQVVAGDGYIVENTPIQTDQDGLAKATLVLGPAPGSNTIQATAINLSAAPIQFNATGKVGAAEQMHAIAGSNGQTGVAGEPLPSPVGVVVTDSQGDPVEGHAVIFTISFGDGFVNGAQQATVHTDPSGEARAFWRLGEVSGPNVLEAVSSSLGSAKEIFTAQGVEGQAAYLEINGSPTISGTVSAGAPRALAVRVIDKNGNPVKNFIVHYQLMKGTGSLTATEATSNADGYASVGFTFGSDAGERVVRAYGDGLANSPVNFTLIGNASAPKSIAIYDGNGQTGTIGMALSRANRVIVKDGNGNPVPGVNVSFIPTQNNGSFVGGTVATTDERGLASAQWKLGTNAGANKAWAIVQGLPQIEISANGVTNNLPVFQQIPAQQVDELEKVEFSISATDADGDNMAFGVRKLPPGAAFDSLVTRLFIWNTGYDNAGLHEVIFTARDSKGDVAEYLVPITINNVNQAPRITNWQPAATNIPVKTGQTQTFTVNAVDPDGDELSCLWFLDGRHVGSSHTYIYQPSMTGVRLLEAKIFDDADTTSRAWQLDVTTSVQLASFSAATQVGNGVKIEWFTARESNNAGFNVLRSDTEYGKYSRINATLIPTDGSGQYAFIDEKVAVGRKYYYKLEDVSYSGDRQLHGPIMVDVALPTSFELQQNYPNPFNPSTNIRYQLPQQTHVKLVVYNLLGQEVRQLVDQVKGAGYYTIVWDGLNARGIPVPSGVYYYKIVAGDYKAAKKMLLLK
ncbi:Ig-like domain-containing protein, partial [candidate division KSB1 bacterium]|nr:Ig-like domain-containing protein [candidate division KSB1 bacterium]